MRANKLILLIGAAFLLLSLLSFVWHLGYFAGHGEAMRYGDLALEPPVPLVGIASLALGAILLFIGNLPTTQERKG